MLKAALGLTTTLETPVDLTAEPTLFDEFDLEMDRIGSRPSGAHRLFVRQDTATAVKSPETRSQGRDGLSSEIEQRCGAHVYTQPQSSDDRAYAYSDSSRSETIGGLLQEALGERTQWLRADPAAAATESRAACKAVAKTMTPGAAAPIKEEPPGTAVRPMPSLPPRGEIAQLGAQKPHRVPRRIGRGRLVPARLTWKPGDPFATSSQPKRPAFRWDVMLTSACITAACGLVCVWLLRTILA